MKKSTSQDFDLFSRMLEERFGYRNISPLGGEVRFMDSLNALYIAELANGDKVFIKRCRDLQICRNEYTHSLALWQQDQDHFIQPLNCHLEAPFSFVSFEYCPGEPLGKIIETEKEELDDARIIALVEDIYAIFLQLKKSDVVHRDIHRFNFMYHAGKLRLIDFQISVSKTHYEEISLFRNPLSVLRLGNVNYKRFAWDDAFRFMDLLNRFIAPLGIPETYSERFRFIKEEIEAHIGKDTIRYKTPGRLKIFFMAIANSLKCVISTRRDIYRERKRIYWQLFRGEDLGQQNGTRFHPESPHAHSQPNSLMKTGVLTHPFLGNYGGMLQAFAMVEALRQQGHDAYNLEYIPRNYRKRISKLSQRFKEAFRVYLLRCNTVFFDFPTPTRLKVAVGRDFAQKYLPTLSLDTPDGINVHQHQLDAIVVGSDQVWRGAYAEQMQSLPFYFLDFAGETLRKSSIAYAASFGTDTWEGKEKDTAKCAALLREFKAVSVREDSGIELCEQHFGVQAEQMPDPTLLLPESRYSEIIEAESTWLPGKKFIGSYVLDKSPGISTLLTESAQGMNLQLQQLKAITKARLKRDRFPLSVAQWLRLIRDAEYLITDSFHGCVFAIIFNTPFVCLGNKRRGTARFDSLLSKYGLQNRLVLDASVERVQEVLRTPIDWSRVNTVHEEEKSRGLRFLNTHLTL